MNKKIGIITYHRAHNFGAALQCYALQKTLQKLGNETVVIDYQQPYIERNYSPIQRSVIRKGLTSPRVLAAYLLKILPRLWRRACAYRQFRNRYLTCTPKVMSASDMPQDLDVYLIGSDQMWSLHCTGGMLDELFFGVFPRPQQSKLCGYAISATIPSLQTIGAKALSTYVRNFGQLSFREETICQEVEQMTQVRGRVVLDPTLLLDENEWEQLAAKPLTNQKYLLTYFLHKGAKAPQFLSEIHAYADKHGYVVKDVFSMALSPNEFLSAIKNASCIITTSFHATVFSLLFRKTFFALKTDNGADVRYSNLLEKLGIPERVIDLNDLASIEEREIDYDAVHQKLPELRKSSMEFLENF